MFVSSYVDIFTTREMLNEYLWNLVLRVLLKFFKFRFLLISEDSNELIIWTPTNISVRIFTVNR